MQECDQKWVAEHIVLKGWWGEIGKRQVKQRLNTQKWPQVFYIFPNAVLTGSMDPRDHHLSRRLLYIVCPAHFFTNIMTDAFNGCPFPPCPPKGCPCYGTNSMVHGDGWVALPRTVTGIDEWVCVYASCWKCHGGTDCTVLLYLQAPLRLMCRV